ncbi:MAG TPA: threonine ammonia-lyase [Patescibacteria group bacterium]|nr:threonine ammonia-lyase [Patescibacteria group bacterium]
MAPSLLPTRDDVLRARETIRGRIKDTPLLATASLSRLTGTSLALKAENLQRTGSFKARGALNRLAFLTEGERAAGVVAASAGNHGQAVAWAAQQLGVPCTVVMPVGASVSKIAATRGYGAKVMLSGEAFDDAMAAAKERCATSGELLVHAFDDPLVIAGQGTIGLELMDEAPDLENLIVPIGGGGLAAGIALALSERRPGLRLIGVQAAACAPWLGRAPVGNTIADGIAVKQPGEMTKAILESRLDDLRTVTDEQVAEAILLLLERSKLLVEGAGAAAVAALLAPGKEIRGSTCALLSGGNIDPSVLLSVVRAGLTRAGRYLMLRVRVPDRPGQLSRVLAAVAAQEGNMVTVFHQREGRADLGILETEIDLTILARDEDHAAEIVAALGRLEGVKVARLD